MSRPYTLLFRLEGPMQSWGYRSRFDYRDTALEPTRSGVIGLVCAAMGIARGEDISRFNAMRMGVRVERQGRPEKDYHTASRWADERAIASTEVSPRDYLADAVFTVGLESEDKEQLEEVAEALRNPRWILFLGRKAFPLAVPPLRPGDSPQPGALEDYLLCGPPGRRVVLESPDGERTQHDWPLDFGQRRFRPRAIGTRFTGKGDPN